jgi:hypothetical protein
MHYCSNGRDGFPPTREVGLTCAILRLQGTDIVAPEGYGAPQILSQ